MSTNNDDYYCNKLIGSVQNSKRRLVGIEQCELYINIMRIKGCFQVGILPTEFYLRGGLHRCVRV